MTLSLISDKAVTTTSSAATQNKQQTQHQQRVHKQQQARGRLAWCHVAASLLLLALHLKSAMRLWISYGPATVLLSPAVGWVVPLCVLWWWHARRQVVALYGTL